MNRPYTVPRRTFLAATLTTMTAAAAGCGFSGNTGDDSANKSGTRQAGARTGTLRVSMLPVATIDPAISGGSSTGNIIQTALWEGLVVLDADDATAVQPGVAEKWDISGDRLTYTFHLRDNATWSNGDRVTAKDFEWNWRRMLTPAIAGEGLPSYNPSTGVVGAVEYMNGETKDFSTVGVKALDDSTFEIKLEQPNPTLLLSLAQYAFMPVHPATMEAAGNKWLNGKNWVSNGAYVLKDFRINDGTSLVANNHYWDSASYHIAGIDVKFNDGGTTADLLSYQTGEIDVSGRIEDDLDSVTSSDVAKELVSSAPNQIRELILLNSENTALNDVRIRKALSMAVDRQALANLAKPCIPGNSMIPAMIKDSDKIPGVKFDVDAAKALLAQAGHPGGEGLPTIMLMDYQSSPWVEAISEMWQKNLGVGVKYDNIERGLFGERRTSLMPADYVGFYALNTAVTPPMTFAALQRILPTAAASVGGLNVMPPAAAKKYLAMVKAGTGSEKLAAFLDQNRLPEAQAAVDLAKKAVAETDETAQSQLLIQMCTAWNDSYTDIPLLWGGYNLLVKPYVKNLRLWPFGSVFSTRGASIQK